MVLSSSFIYGFLSIAGVVSFHFVRRPIHIVDGFMYDCMGGGGECIPGENIGWYDVSVVSPTNY
jgi:hypothetical protein